MAWRRFRNGDLAGRNRGVLLCALETRDGAGRMTGTAPHSDRSVSRDRDRGEYRQAAGAGASKLITGPVPMSAFGGKAEPLN